MTLLQEILKEDANLTVDEVIDHVVEKIDKFMKIDPKEFFSMDDQEKYDAIDDEIDEFFAGYYDVDIHGEFISANRKKIISGVVKKL